MYTFQMPTSKENKRRKAMTIAKDMGRWYNPRIYVCISRINNKQCFDVGEIMHHLMFIHMFKGIMFICSFAIVEFESGLFKFNYIKRNETL